MDSHIEAQLRACETCERHSTAQAVNTWPKDEAIWTRIHIDWAHDHSLGEILIVVDAFSGWLEAVPCPSRATGEVIKVLREIFARFGTPRTIVSDNGKEFTGEQFSAWLTRLGIRILHSPQYHPKSNGAAERMVRYVKEGLRTARKLQADPIAFLQKLLFVHRSTSRRPEGGSPARLMLSREPACPLVGPFKQGECVVYNPKPGVHKEATFIVRKGTNTSVIEVDRGKPIVAHDNQVSPQIPRRSNRVRRPPIRFTGGGDV